MKNSLGFLLLIPLQLALYNLLGTSTFFIEKIYTPIYELYSMTIGGIFNRVTFSVGDILYGIIGIGLFWFLIKNIIQLFKANWKYFKKSFYQLLVGLNIIVPIYFLAWGWVYFEKDLETIYPANNIQISEIKDLIEKYDKDCKEIRIHLNETKNGVFQSEYDAFQYSKMFTEEYQNLPNNLKRFQKPYYTRVKKSLYYTILMYLGIDGYFNPFTRECQYTNLISDYKKPNTIAHEMGHKWAFGKENEANFVAFLVGENSKELSVQYSTKYRALRSLLNSVYIEDSQFVKQKINQFSEGMKNDRRADSLLQVKYGTFFEKKFKFLNNTFLKMNQQEGTSSYNRYVKLIIGYERKRTSN